MTCVLSGTYMPRTTEILPQSIPLTKEKHPLQGDFMPTLRSVEEPLGVPRKHLLTWAMGRTCRAGVEAGRPVRR